MGQGWAAGLCRGFQSAAGGPRAHSPPSREVVPGRPGGQCQPLEGPRDQSVPRGQCLLCLGTGDNGIPRAVSWSPWPLQASSAQRGAGKLGPGLQERRGGPTLNRNETGGTAQGTGRLSAPGRCWSRSPPARSPALASWPGQGWARIGPSGRCRRRGCSDNISHFNVHSSVAFSAFTILCSRHLCLFQNILRTSK